MKKTPEQQPDAVPPHPMQPLYTYNGALRFKQNKIVDDLLTFATAKGMGLNEIACRKYTQEDREQFAQLIGYSLSGYGELSYVREGTYRTADLMATSGEDDKTARIHVLENELAAIRKHLRRLVPEVFRIHPDDLHE